MRREAKTLVRTAVAIAATPVILSVGAAFGQFVDVAPSVGLTLAIVSGTNPKDYIVDVNGNGAAFFDYDGDGDADLLIASGSSLENYRVGGDQMIALYRNDRDRFVDVTEDAGLRTSGWAMGVCVADYDNDGHQDFYLTAYGPNRLFRNLGNATFEEAPHVGGSDDRWSTNCAFGDYDRDGHVDLYVANYLAFDEANVPRRGETLVCRYMGADVFCGPTGLRGERDVLYRNNGDGTFDDVTVEAGVGGVAYNGFGVAFSDLDNDGWPDIYVANDTTPNLLYRNNADGTFDEMGLISGAALNDEGREQAGMGVGSGDYDGDGQIDLFVTNFSGELNTLYRNTGDMVFVDVTLRAGLGGVAWNHVGWGTAFRDLDNDGWPDIFVGNGHVYPEVDGLDVGQSYLQRKELYRNRGNGTFEEVAPGSGPDLGIGKPARGVAFSDYDEDGDIDVLAVNMNEAPSLYRNDGAGGHWISFRLEGVQSNRDGIGARIEVDAGGRTQVGYVQSGGSYLSHNDMRMHFGLGEAAVADRVRIRWPSGAVDELEDVGADAFLTVREGEGIVSR
jgi:hypothetical protein